MAKTEATSSTIAPDNGTEPVAAKATGRQTAKDDRALLPNGEPNKSPSGDLPDPVTPEPGIKALKAIHQITYGDNQSAQPDMLFVPVSADERKELLRGEFPAAKEPTANELKLFNLDSGSEFE